ncbi:MAG TPA: lipid II flippase MurJ, partial [Candidatus Cloacimonas sp.]|nr:lipid II flippase MurJ [Candidatus Cloacimonas sp.]
GIREVNLIADSLMASFLPIGSITALSFGNRLMQLPLGIFGISTGTAVLPFYSRCVTNGKYDELSESIRFTGLNLAYIMLPVTTIILALGEDFVRILFQSGAFNERAVWMTSQALIFYSLGLVFFGLNQTITPIFYAHKDTKTPVKIAAAMVALNITLNFILMQFMAHRGLALSTSITAGVNYFILLYLIRKKMPGITFSGIIRNIAKTLLICLIIFFLLVIGRNILPVQGRIELLIRDAVFSVVAFGLFYLSAILIKIDYITQAGKALCKRFLRK